MPSLADVIVHFVGDDSNYRSVLANVESQGRSSSSALGSFFRDAFAFATGGLIESAIRGIASAIADLPRSAVGAVASFEDMRASINALTAKEFLKAGLATDFNDALTQTKGLAEDTLHWIEQLAIQSPFNTSDVQSAFQMAQSYGFLATAAKSVEDAQAQGIVTAQRLTQASLNYLAATGQSPAVMDRVTLALGQMSASGKVMAGDLNQLTSAGIQAKQILADEFAGGSIAKLNEMVGSGLIPADQAILAIVRDMELMGGAAAQTANNWTGLIASMQDIGSFALRDAFMPALDEIKPLFIDLVSFLQGPAVQGAIDQFGSNLASMIAGPIQFITGTVIPGFQAGWASISPVIDAASLAIEAFSSILGDLAGSAFAWGSNVIEQFAAGISAASGFVADALSGIGEMVTYWLEPGSPPKLLPDLDTWGTGAAQAYLDGWSEADVTALDAIGQSIERVLKATGMSESGAAASVLAMQQALVSAMTQFRETGSISEATFAAIREQAGPAADQVERVARAHIAAEVATRNLTEAQQVLDRTEGDLLATQAAIAAADAGGDTEKGNAARTRLGELQAIRAQAEAKKQAAAAQQQQAKSEINRLEAIIKLMERQQQLQEKANQKKGGGGGGGAAKEAQQQDKLAAAQQKYAYATANTAGKMAMVRAELDKLTPADEKYYEKKLQLEQLESQYTREQESASKERQRLLEQEAQKQQRVADAQWQYQYAIADTAGKAALLKKRLDDANLSEEDRYRLLTQLDQVEKQYAREQESAAKKADAAGRKGGGRGSGGKAKVPTKRGKGADGENDTARQQLENTMRYHQQQVHQQQVQAMVGRLRTMLNAALAAIIDPATPGRILQAAAPIISNLVGWILGQVPNIIRAFQGWSVAFLGWIAEAWPGIMQGLGQLGSQVIMAIGQALPGIIGALRNWGFALLDWIAANGPTMLGQLGQLVGQLLDTLGAQVPGIVQAFAAWGAALVQWVIINTPLLFAELLKLDALILGWIAERAPGIGAQLLQWGLQFVQWVIPTAAQLIGSLGQLFGQLLLWIVQQVPGLDQALTAFVTAFVVWPMLIWGQLAGQLASVWENIKSWIAGQTGPMSNAAGSLGKAFIDGIVAMIKSGIGSITGAVKGVIDGAIDAARNALQSRSPSRRTAQEIGKPFMQGIGVGLEQAQPGVMRSTIGAVQSMVQAGQDAVQSITSPLRGGSGGLGGNVATPQGLTVHVSVGQVNDPVDVEMLGHRVGNLILRKLR